MQLNISAFTVFRLLTDFVCLYTYEFWLSLWKIVRSSVILLLLLFANLHVARNITVKFLEVWNKFNNFCTLVTMATSAILNFINTPKASTHYDEYSYDVSWRLMKEIKKKLNPPFLFPWQLRQSLSYRFRFFGLSRSTRFGCDRNHYCKNVWSLEWI